MLDVEFCSSLRDPAPQRDEIDSAVACTRKQVFLFVAEMMRGVHRERFDPRRAQAVARLAVDELYDQLLHRAMLDACSVQ